MFWVGILLLPILHLLYFSVVPVVYDLLYKKVVRPIIKFDFGSAVVIWVMLLGMGIMVQREVVWPAMVVLMSSVVGIILCIVGLVFLVRLLIDKVFEPYVLNPFLSVQEFNWQVFMRHYNWRHDIPDYEYTIGDKFSQGMMHFLFWLQPVTMVVLLHFGGNYIDKTRPELFGLTDSYGAWFLLIWLAIGVIISFFVNRHYDKKAEEQYYDIHPEKRPRKERKLPKEKPYQVHWWNRLGWKLGQVKGDFREWRHAVKEQVCPFVEFID